MKRWILALSVSLFALPTLAAEITPGNLIGRYKVSARVMFQNYYANFRVLSTTEFEVQRTHADGRAEEVCNGRYQLAPAFFWHEAEIKAGKMFRGIFTCPSDRSRDVDFNVDFRNATTDSLVKGTSVTLTSSIARGMRINAHIKKR